MSPAARATRSGESDEDIVRLYLNDIGRHALLTKEDEVRLAKRVEANDNLLTIALTANLAQHGVRQNEDKRLISATARASAAAKRQSRRFMTGGPKQSGRRASRGSVRSVPPGPDRE